MQQYELKRPIGGGGMGQVFEGCKLTPLDLDGNRPVAIKVIPPRDLEFEERQATELFKREATLSWRISHEHPNLATTYDYGISTRGYRYLIMELVDGVSLEDIVKGHEPLPHHVIRRVTIDILGALAHLHERKVIHRDISARNVMISRKGAVKLIDFGLVKTAYKSGSVCFRGTTPYASPEALMGRELGPMADLYSLGALLYRLLTGIYPYGETSEEILKAVHDQRPVPVLPEDTPDDLVRLVGGLIPLKPGDRDWKTAEDVLDFLGSYDEPVILDAGMAIVVEKRAPARTDGPQPTQLPDLGWPFAELDPPAASEALASTFDASQAPALTPDIPPAPAPTMTAQGRFMRWLPWALVPLAFAAGLAVFAFAYRPPPASASAESAQPVPAQPATAGPTTQVPQGASTDSTVATQHENTETTAEQIPSLAPGFERATREPTKRPKATRSRTPHTEKFPGYVKTTYPLP